MERGRVARTALMIALVACRAAPPPPPPRPRPPPPPPAAPPPPPPHNLAAPPVALTLIDSPTAQVFHIVDELSRWYPRAPGEHAQYAEWAEGEMPLDDAERLMLTKHAKLREKRRWGSLDQAFYVNATIEEAARAALEQKVLTAADAQDERALLEHFDVRLRPFVAAKEKIITAFEAQLATELPRAAPLIAQLGRFCGVSETLPVSVVLVPSPAPVQGEGRVTRRMIVLEVSGDGAVPAFFHHLAHAVLLQGRSTIAIAARKCDEAVDDETLEEGLAYAFAPGLVHPSGRDLLRENVEADRAGSLRDPRIRGERLGLALREDLSAALEGAGGEGEGKPKMSSFMPKACDAWANVAKH